MSPFRPFVHHARSPVLHCASCSVATLVSKIGTSAAVLTFIGLSIFLIIDLVSAARPPLPRPAHDNGWWLTARVLPQAHGEGSGTDFLNNFIVCVTIGTRPAAGCAPRGPQRTRARPQSWWPCRKACRWP